MILVADGGSTKTSWCLTNKNKERIHFTTEGYNPYFTSSTYITKSLKESIKNQFNPEAIDEVHFYGAGCQTDKKYVVKDALEVVFPKAAVNVDVDLLAAARALLGTNAGFAAILGTGTNTCIYDGRYISKNIDSLGFILGDEGSGGALGKKLAGDFIRGYMPEPISTRFYNTYQLSTDQILDQIYTKPLANKFCAEFCKFLKEIIDEEYAYELVRSSFQAFFKNLVCHYPNYNSYTFNCIGSVGYHFKAILEETAAEFNMEPGKIISSPIEGLVQYHSENMSS